MAELYPSELLAVRLAKIRETVKIARAAYPHSDKWLNMYADDVEDMLRLIDSIQQTKFDTCPECGEEIEHEWQWELHAHNESCPLGIHPLRLNGESCGHRDGNIICGFPKRAHTPEAARSDVSMDHDYTPVIWDSKKI